MELHIYGGLWGRGGEAEGGGERETGHAFPENDVTASQPSL